MLTAGPRRQFRRWRRNMKSLYVCSVLRCPDLWLQCTKLALHCNHRSGHLKTEHTESLFLLRLHLGNWPRGPAVSMTSELLVSHEKTWTVAAADCVGCARVSWEINFLLTFETAPFFCVYPVYIGNGAFVGFDVWIIFFSIRETPRTKNSLKKNTYFFL